MGGETMTRGGATCISLPLTLRGGLNNSSVTLLVKEENGKLATVNKPVQEVVNYDYGWLDEVKEYADTIYDQYEEELKLKLEEEKLREEEYRKFSKLCAQYGVSKAKQIMRKEKLEKLKEEENMVMGGYAIPAGGTIKDLISLIEKYENKRRKLREQLGESKHRLYKRLQRSNAYLQKVMEEEIPVDMVPPVNEVEQNKVNMFHMCRMNIKDIKLFNMLHVLFTIHKFNVSKYNAFIVLLHMGNNKFIPIMLQVKNNIMFNLHSSPILKKKKYNMYINMNKGIKYVNDMVNQVTIHYKNVTLTNDPFTPVQEEVKGDNYVVKVIPLKSVKLLKYQPHVKDNIELIIIGVNYNQVNDTFSIATPSALWNKYPNICKGLNDNKHIVFDNGGNLFVIEVSDKNYMPYCKVDKELVKTFNTYNIPTYYLTNNTEVEENKVSAVTI